MPIPTAGTVRHIAPIFNLSRAVNGMKAGMTLKQLENRAAPRFASTPLAHAPGEYYRQCAGHALGDAADVMAEAKTSLSAKQAAALDKAVAWMTPGPGQHFDQAVLNRLTTLGALHAGVCTQLAEQRQLAAQAAPERQAEIQGRVDALIKARDALKAGIVTIGLKGGASKVPLPGGYDGTNAKSLDFANAIAAGQSSVVNCMKVLGAQNLMDGIAKAIVTEPLLRSIEARLPEVYARIIAEGKAPEDLMQEIQKAWADKTQKVITSHLENGNYHQIQNAIMDLLKLPDYVIQPQPGSKEPVDKPPGLDAPPAIPQALLDKAGPGGGVFYNNSPQHVVVNMDGLLQDLFGKLEQFGGVPGAKQPQLLEICNLMKSVFDQQAENLIKLGALQERTRIDGDLIRRQADELRFREAEGKDLRAERDEANARLRSFMERGKAAVSSSSSSSSSTSSLSEEELAERLHEVDESTVLPQQEQSQFQRSEPDVKTAQPSAFNLPVEDIAASAGPDEDMVLPTGPGYQQVSVMCDPGAPAYSAPPAPPRPEFMGPLDEPFVENTLQRTMPSDEQGHMAADDLIRTVQHLPWSEPSETAFPPSSRLPEPQPHVQSSGNPFLVMAGAPMQFERFPVPLAENAMDPLPDLRGDDEVQRASQGEIPTQQAVFGGIPRVRLDLSPQFKSTTLESDRNGNPASGVSKESGTHADTTPPTGVTGFAGFYDSYLRELSKPSEDRDVREFNENGKATTTLKIQEAKQPMLKPSDVLKYEFERSNTVRNLTHRDGKAPPTQPIDPGLVSAAHQDNSLGDLFRRNPGVVSVSSLISALNSKRDEVESPVSPTSFTNEEDVEGEFNEAFKGVDEMEFRNEERAGARTVANLKSLFERSASRDSGIGGDEAVAKANAGVDPNGHLHFAAFDKKIDQLNALGRTPRRRVQFAGV